MDFRNYRMTAVHLLEHAATVGVGVALIILGVALTFTVMFALPGIILVVGICLLAAGVTRPLLRRRWLETMSR